MTEQEQAVAAFHEVAETFDLPKFPEDFTDEHHERFSSMNIEDPRSVFEESAIIRYQLPDDDPRGIVILALYNVHHGIFIPLDECAEIHFGGRRKIPKEYMVCFIGDSVPGQLHFLSDGESWYDLGAKSAVKIVR